MSKLAKLIKAKQTGQRKRLPPHKYTSVDTESSVVPYHLGTCYRLGVTFSHQMCVDDNAHYGVSLDDAVFSMRQAIVEEVFGEFRPMLIDIDLALLNYDFNKARTLLKQLEHKMFYDDVIDGDSN